MIHVWNHVKLLLALRTGEFEFSNIVFFDGHIVRAIITFSYQSFRMTRKTLKIESNIYIGRTTRQLHKRIKEHHPVGLIRGTISTIRSSILKHLVDSNHNIDIEKAFRILYTTPASEYFTTRTKHLNMAEAILINFYKPELCSQKKLVHNVLLPWPSLFRWFLYYVVVFILLCFILFYLILILLNYN